MNDHEEVEKLRLEEEELYRLEFYQERIKTSQLKEQVKNAEIAKNEVTIRNHLLSIKALENANGNHRKEINIIRSKAKDWATERDAFVVQLCEKYNIDSGQFGYDNETREILEFDKDSDEAEDKSNDANTIKE